MILRLIVIYLAFNPLSVSLAWGQGLPASALTVLHRFSYANSESPAGQLLLAANGTFYGVLASGGANGGGAIFSFSDSAPLQVLYSFGVGEIPVANANGSLPNAPLIFGSDGNLYGTTSTGGPNTSGTVFQVTPTGNLTTLGSFGAVGEGQQPFGGLYLASDGYFYGTTIAGDSSLGTVFRVNATVGSVQTVFAFPMDGSQGGEPVASLIQGSDGALYGTTRAGAGSNNANGGVFRLTLGGTATNLVSFPGTVTAGMGALILGGDGAFCGLASSGEFDGGFAYKITTDGVATQLHSFGSNDSQPEGAYPSGALIIAHDGNFYGVTTGGGVYNNGVIFQMTSDGTVTTMHSFTDSEGDGPIGGLVEGQDGRLYGMTEGQFTHNPALFKLALIPAAPTMLQSTSLTNEVSLTWQGVVGASTYSVYEGAASGTEAASAVLTQITATSATITGLHGGTTYYFRVSATNEAGEGPPSAEASAAPASPPSSGGGGSFDVSSLWLLFFACACRIALRKLDTASPDRCS
jgi:uncharacterized repeat protein (TIGR03803 family)